MTDGLRLGDLISAHSYTARDNNVEATFICLFCSAVAVVVAGEQLF